MEWQHERKTKILYDLVGAVLVVCRHSLDLGCHANPEKSHGPFCLSRLCDLGWFDCLQRMNVFFSMKGARHSHDEGVAISMTFIFWSDAAAS